MVLLAVAAALLMALLPAGSAQAAPPAPTVPLPPQLDLIDGYEGQKLCDPTPKAGALKLRDVLWQTYGRDIWAGISRDCDVTWDRGVSEHKDGRAIDWGVNVRKPNRVYGDEFVAWAAANDGANARRLGIMYIIWDSKMWRLYDMGRGWTEYNSCLSRFTSTSYDTTCHRDHVHISMTWHGAGAWTSWYDGSAVTQPACRAGSPVKVPAGTPAAPAAMFDPLAGVGVAGGQSCYLGRSIQTLQVPVTAGGSTVQKVRVTHLHANAPSPVKVWTNAGASVQLNRSDSFPRTLTLPVAADGLIYVQQPIGQAGLRIEGVGQSKPLAAGQVLEVPVAGGSTGVPADAKAVALNLTVTEPATAGYLRVFPCGTAMPATSNVNFAAGQTVASAVNVGVGAGGMICIYASAIAHVVVDFSGYYPSSSTLTLLAPERLLDTRKSGSRLVPDAETKIVVPTGAAAAVSLTITEPMREGWLSAYPCGIPWPGTSNINYGGGQTIAGSALVKIGAGSTLCLRSSAPTHVIVDLMGVIASGGDYAALTPTRITDTRVDPGAPVTANEELRASPPAGATVALNLVSTGSERSGWLQAYPCGLAAPGTSSVNFSAGETVANSALVKTGTGGKVCLRSMVGTHVVADATAVLGPQTFQSVPPRRLVDTRLP